MVIDMKEPMYKIRYKVLELTYGQMDKNIMVNGFRIKCMVKELINGLMGINLLGIIRKIKKKDKAFSTFQMEEHLRELGF